MNAASSFQGLLNGIPMHWIGLALAASALMLWSFSPFCFAAVGRRVGPFATNVLRLSLGFAALLTFVLLRTLTGTAFHLPPASAWLWLGSSGLVGLVLGDYFLYTALSTVGPERTSQFQVVAPAATAIIAWLFLREALSIHQLTGMALTLSGVSLATWTAARTAARSVARAGLQTDSRNNKSPVPKSHSGAWAPVGFCLFQAIGSVLARQGFLAAPDLDPLLATTIRIGSGACAVLIIAAIRGRFAFILAAFQQPKLVKILVAGTAAGPVIGMVCFISALKFAPAGVVTTIAFMTPLVVIPVGAWYYGTRIGFLAMVGTAISLVGVVLLGFG